MESFMSFVQTASFVLFIVLSALMIVCFMALAQTNRRLNRLRRRYDTLLRGRGELDMEELIGAHSNDIEENSVAISRLDTDLRTEMRDLTREFDKVTDNIANSIQKVGFHRYNAFDYVTNEMSFSVALLDSKSNGIILTSIFGRENSTTFAKEIRKGSGLQELSIEEEIALGRALQGE